MIPLIFIFNSLLKTSYSNFGALSSRKFEIAAFFMQSDWLECLLSLLIGLKERQFQTFGKITVWNKNSLSLIHFHYIFTWLWFFSLISKCYAIILSRFLICRQVKTCLCKHDEIDWNMLKILPKSGERRRQSND